MSDPALTKLLKIDSELLAQETELTTQLDALKVKRASLHDVLQMFDAPHKKVPSKEYGSVGATSEVAPTAAVAEETVAAPLAPPVKTTRSPGRTEKKSRLSKPRNQTPMAAKRRGGWQRYVREEFRKIPLPEAVFAVLKRTPKKVFEIGVVVDAVFVEKIPQWARQVARERVSNILAEGARKNRWRRGKPGCYSMSSPSKGKK
ncbi:MAG: hypothetical protein QNJ46_23405 [Leptolyngbyaceae cyanobacterium MO_188.B28]|nr:hypothetical protein [Leptolyngbyaceae cyanobacterium MO_188.B28]